VSGRSGPAGAPGDAADSRDNGAGGPPPEPRPWLERIGLAAIALVMFALLSVMAVASWAGGEWILAAMSASGAVLTIGVGLLTLVRG
jgi:hypothetical protein